MNCTMSGVTQVVEEERTYYVAVRRGVEYTAAKNVAGWHVLTRRLALGRFSAGGCKYFDSLAQLCESVAVFAGLDRLVVE